MGRPRDEVDIDFGVETSPKQLFRFVAFGLGGLATLGAVAAVMVYMTSPVARHGQESMTAGLPSFMSIFTAVASGGKLKAHDFDNVWSCANKSLGAAMAASQNMGSRLEHISPSRRMQMDAELKEKCGRFGQ